MNKALLWLFPVYLFLVLKLAVWLYGVVETHPIVTATVVFGGLFYATRYLSKPSGIMTVRPLTRTPINMKHVPAALCFLAIAFGIIGFGTKITDAQALSFGSLAPHSIGLASTWKIQNEEAYKNDRLAAYQSLLKDRGVTDSHASVSSPLN